MAGFDEHSDRPSLTAAARAVGQESILHHPIRSPLGVFPSEGTGPLEKERRLVFIWDLDQGPSPGSVIRPR